jgi:hypothetical protein
MIERCSFGAMIIDQRTYDADLMIYPDERVVDHWHREAGHRLIYADIADLASSKPDIIVAGTGIYGLMRPAPDLAAKLADQDIELVTARTKSAAKTFNRLKGTNKRVAACFHLTC